MIPADLTSVLQRDDWLRRMARQLVQDPHAADDLAQDAWVAGLEKKRLSEEDRGWLFGVLRNRGRASARKDARSRARAEQLIESRGESTAPAAEDVVADMQLRGRAAEALAALEEPYRTTVYLVHVQDLSLTEAAQQMGIARSTAHARLGAGIDRLRNRLDDAYGGDRKAWTAQLLPLIPVGAQASGLPMGGAWLAAGSALMIAALAVLATRTATPPSAPGLEPVVKTAALAVPEPIAVAEPAPRVTARESGFAEPRLDPNIPSTASAAPKPTASPPRVPTSSEVALDATFVLSDGSPASGATWRLLASPGYFLDPAPQSVPEGWVHPAGTLTADGALEASFDAPGGLRYELLVSAPGHVTWSREIRDLTTESLSGIGTISMERAGVIEGTVVDEEGSPRTGHEWGVSVDCPGNAYGPAIRQSCPVDPLTGAYRLTGVRPGRVSLTVRPTALRGAQVATVIAGETVRLDLRADPHEPESGVAIVAFTLASHGPTAFVDPGAIRLLGPNGSTVAPNELPVGTHALIREHGPFRFEGLGAAPYELSITDPRYLPRPHDAIMSGSRTVIELVGSASIRFEAVTADGTDPGDLFVALDPFQPTAEPGRTVGATGALLKFNGGAPIEPGQWVHGVVPGSYAVTVNTPSHHQELEITGLGPGESRTLQVTLAPRSAISGRVLLTDGTPAKGRVHIVRPAEIDDSPSSFLMGPNGVSSSPEYDRTILATLALSDGGRFEADAPPDGEFIVVAMAHEGIRSESPRFNAGGPLPPSIDLVLSTGATLRGVVTFPDGIGPEGHVVHVEERDLIAFSGRPPTASLDREGRFQIGPLTPGTTKLFISRGPRIESGADLVLAELELADGETVDHTFAFPGVGVVPLQIELAGFRKKRGATIEFNPEGSTGTQVRGRFKNSTVMEFGLEPGTYSVTVTAGSEVARHTGVEVTRATPGPLRFEANGIGHRFRVLGPSGAPLARTRVKVSLPASPFRSSRPLATTDEAGFVTFHLPENTYRIELGRRSFRDPVWAQTLDWGTIVDDQDIQLVVE